VRYGFLGLDVLIWFSAVNCMYWEQRFPRLLTNKELLDLRSTGQNRLLVIADITCDKGGSMEFLKKYSSIHNPFLRFVHRLTLRTFLRTFDNNRNFLFKRLIFHEIREVNPPVLEIDSILLKVRKFTWFVHLSGIIPRMTVFKTTWKAKEYYSWPSTASRQNFRGRCGFMLL